MEREELLSSKKYDSEKHWISETVTRTAKADQIELYKESNLEMQVYLLIALMICGIAFTDLPAKTKVDLTEQPV